MRCPQRIPLLARQTLKYSPLRTADTTAALSEKYQVSSNRLLAAPLSPNSRSLAHEISVSDYVCGLLLRGIGSRERRKAINQTPPAPINELLTEAMQALLCAQVSKQISAHARVAMMCPIEDFRFDQEFC